MTISEIRSEINQYKREINTCRGQIAELEKQIGELEELKHRFSSLQTGFEGSMSQSRSRLGKLQDINYNTRMVSGYYSGMSALLSGGEYHTVLAGLTEAGGVIQRKIASLYEEIGELNSRISECQYQISVCERHLAEKMREEA